MEQRFFGWTPSAPDRRDTYYRAPEHIVTALPPKVDLSKPPLPYPFEPPFNQGRLGSCGPNTVASDLIHDMINEPGVALAIPSRLFIYYATRSLMGTIQSDSGVNNRDMLRALATYGWATEQEWPYDVNRFTTRPPEEVIAAAKARRIGRYERVPQDLTSMQAALASGEPFVFGFTVYESFVSQTVEKSGDVPMPRATERRIGGHDVLIVGYDDATQRFRFKNSYGPEWGDKGYGTVPYAYALSPSLAADFWLIRDSGMKPTVSTTTTPAPAPSDGAQLVFAETVEPGRYRLVKV